MFVRGVLEKYMLILVYVFYRVYKKKFIRKRVEENTYEYNIVICIYKNRRRNFVYKYWLYGFL